MVSGAVSTGLAAQHGAGGWVGLGAIAVLGLWFGLHAVVGVRRALRDRERGPVHALRALGRLLPRDEALVWVEAHRGFLADTDDRRAHLLSVVARMPRQLWTSWSARLFRWCRTRQVSALAAVLEFGADQSGERPAWPAVLSLSGRDLRALARGAPVWVRSTRGRLIDVRLRRARRSS
ncbi:hypothetical protein [Saccharothrix xinjiangensis]|uniref:Uncharacterized protein n=1 Tax=Saccharothrix xinjiangensis TaxID=204798 RepID=A0ABV9Y4M8_9PSEU